MRKKRGIKKLVTFALLGVFMFSNTIPYQQFIQKNKQLEIRVQSQKKSKGLDVGKADWFRITLKFDYLEKVFWWELVTIPDRYKNGDVW